VALAWETVWVVEEDVVDGLLEVDVVLDDVLDVVLEDVIDDVIDVDDAVELHVVEGVDIDEGDHCEDQVGLSDDAPKMSVAVESGEPRLKSPVCNTGTEVMMTCPALVPLGATRMTVSMYDTPASVTSTPVAVAIAAGNAESVTEMATGSEK